MLLVSTNGPIAINKALYEKLPYDPDRDLAPLSLLVSAPLILVVDPKLPVGNLDEFIGYAMSHPGKLSYGTAGVGSDPASFRSFIRGKTRRWTAVIGSIGVKVTE